MTVAEGSNVITPSIALKTIDGLPQGGPIYIYGSSVGGRRMHRVLTVLAGVEIAGFVDTFKSGELLGLPILSLEAFKELDHRRITLVIASSFFKPIYESVASLPLAACFDARPILRIVPPFVGEDDLSMEDDAFRAFIEWRMRETAVERSLHGSSAPFPVRVKFNAVDRPSYAWSMLEAAKLAVALGIPAISAIEFGVAGGNGLVALEEYADEIEKIMPVKFAIFGFDTGVGLPPTKDYRDVPFQWQEGDYRMDQDALRRRLTRSELILGEIGQTIGTFFETHRPPPLGCCFIDVDYYSSTAQALKCFEANSRHYLPRVNCYFDDIQSEFVGELLAIKEFNARHPMRKFAQNRLKIGHLHVTPALWHELVYDFHDFAHPLYNARESSKTNVSPLL